MLLPIGRSDGPCLLQPKPVGHEAALHDLLEPQPLQDGSRLRNVRPRHIDVGVAPGARGRLLIKVVGDRGALEQDGHDLARGERSQQLAKQGTVPELPHGLASRTAAKFSD